MTLAKRITSSAYLSALRQAWPEFEPLVLGEQRVDEARLQAEIEAMDQCLENRRDQRDERCEKLRLSKQRFALLWSIAALSDSITFSRLGFFQSAYAERGIQVALDIAWHSQKIGKLFVNTKDTNPKDSGLFILALGKLGGLDLNFSSDIDLIAFYDKDKLQIAPMHGASYAVTECLKQLSSILSDVSEQGFVWRVDWRLRPHASLRNLSMVAEKALDFYHYHARPWHRLAMLKARSVAGNIALGEDFLADLRSFLWRYNLDYRAIDDIAKLKTKINLEHPALQQQRAQEDEALDKGQGFNLKLGHGGIREIEFMVNALQLLWGGRKPGLRVCNILQALSVIEDEALMDKQAVSELQQAYIFLRQAENCLQMLDNAQRYHLPDDDGELNHFLTLAGFKDWIGFNTVLSAHRAKVYSLFNNLFLEKEFEGANKEENAGSVSWELVVKSERAQEIVEDWQDGFQVYGVAPEQAHHFEPLLSALLHEIGQSECDIEPSVKQIDDYFKLLPRGGQYFRLLRDFPWLVQKLIAPLLLSPTMSSLLHQSPHIIDRFLEAQGADAGALDATIVFSNSDYEYRLENLRRLANEELYLRYSQYFEEKINSAVFQQQLTKLAEELLAAAIRVACEEMDIKEAPIAIIGFGKLGSGGMMPKSDLDLVYLCESMQQHALASQFASRLNTIINTPMREGRVYELDTRLRPSGNSGSVTISLQSYQQHQRTRAHTWPHLALVPARFIAGNPKVGREFANIKREILSRPRDVQQFKNDCAKMLRRVQAQRITPAENDQFTAKLRPGGLFELEYLVNCMAVLHCIQHPDAAGLAFEDIENALVRQVGNKLRNALDVLRTLQLEIRLFGHDGMRFSELPEPILSHVLTALGCHDIEALIDKITQSVALSTTLMVQFFDGVAWETLSEWKETQVIWRE